MRLTLAIVAAASFVSLASVGAQTPSVTGEVTFGERVALPSTALLEVSLEDVSRAGSAGDVVSRLTQRTPSGSPIPFELPFDAARIDPRSRYAVRAEIRDGRRILFSSFEEILAVTQGRGSKVRIPLRMVNAPVKVAVAAAPAKPSAPSVVPPVALRPLPPAVELGALPATFTGTLACEDCAGLLVDLNLFANDSFFMRTVRVGQPGADPVDDVGSWVWSSDRRVLILKTSGGALQRFALRDAQRLRKLDDQGLEIEAKTPQELRRRPAFKALDVIGSFTGAYTADGGGVFVECSTGQSWPVAPTGASEAARAAYVGAGKRLGSPLVLTVRGRVESRQPAGTVLVAESVSNVNRGGPCATRFAALPLENTPWALTTLGSAPVVGRAGASAPSIVFRGESRSFAGTAECVRLTGRYQVASEEVVLTPTGTMTACRTADPLAQAMTQSLASARRYRIAGTTLELYDVDQRVLARFEGK